MKDLPRLLSDLTPVPGVLKEDYTDFEVEELPLYPFRGEGTHTYFLVEKRGLSTMQAVQDVAQALGRMRYEIGYAGMKDARAVTRQWMSLEHVDEAAMRGLEIPRMQILALTRHTNKLRIGHLRGNRFEIKVRQTQPERLAQLQDGLATLTQKGAPNYFGPQRFGGRGDAWEVGRAVVRNQLDGALDIVLGGPTERDHGDIRLARKRYDAGDYEGARQLWPGMFRDERRALRTLTQTRGRKKRAFLAIDRSLRRFYISAYQSHLFNQIVAQRLERGLGRLMIGDLAYRHAGGAVFEVIDLDAEQPRADSLEISPSGPLLGYRMSRPSGEPGKVEDELLVRENLTLEEFHSRELRVKGGRRPLRFPIGDATIRLGADERGAYLALRFTLPPGCYATSLLRELFAEPAADVDAGTDDLEEDGQ